MVDELGKELPGLNDMLNSEGAIEVVKVGWFSDRLVQNYDLMVVYLRKPTEAAPIFAQRMLLCGGLHESFSKNCR